MIRGELREWERLEREDRRDRRWIFGLSWTVAILVFVDVLRIFAS